jgi:hypothetical protein
LGAETFAPLIVFRPMSFMNHIYGPVPLLSKEFSAKKMQTRVVDASETEI